MTFFTACYTKLERGYMGQLLEWPQVITEGNTLEECRAMLTDAAQEMAEAYKQEGQEIKRTPFFVEALPISLENTAVLNVG